MRRSFKIVKMDLTQHEKTVGNHGNMREVYIVHGQVLQLPDSGNMLRVPTMAGCSYPDSSVLHQQSTDLCLGELIFLEFRVWLIRSLVIVMRIDAGMTFISNKSMVFGFFPESVGHRIFSWDHYVCFEKILVPINPLSWASWACRSTIYRDAQSRLPLFLRLVGFELWLCYLRLRKLTSQQRLPCSRKKDH